MVLSLFLSIVQYTPITLLHSGSQELVLTSYTAQSSTGGDIFPGSRNAVITLQVRNNESGNITNVQGCFYFNTKYIKPADGKGSCSDATTPGGRYEAAYEPGEVFQLSTTVNVDKRTPPNTYWLTVEVTYILTNNSSKIKKSVTFTLPLQIKNYPPVTLTVVDTWWSSNEVYPGTSSATLNIKLLNKGSTNVQGGSAIIEVPEPLRPSEVRLNLPAISSGGYATLAIRGLDIPINTSPKAYEFVIRYNSTASTSDGVTYTYRGKTAFKASVSKPSTPYIKIIDYGWVTASYNNSRNAGLYITIQNLDHSTINAIVATLELPTGMITRDGRGYLVTSSNTPLNFGNILTLRFSGINVSNYEGSQATFNISVKYLATYNNAQYYITRNYSITLNLVSEDIIYLTQVKWLHNGAIAEALPTAKGLTLQVSIANYGVDAVTTVIPKLKLPEGFTLKSFSGSCINGLAPGSQCELRFAIDISGTVNSGIYGSELQLNYMIRSGNTLMYSSKMIQIYLPISDPNKFLPNLTIGNYWWGSTAPTTAYGLERMMPAHIEIVNTGRYGVVNVEYSLVTLNKTVRIIYSRGLCTSSLPSGGICRITPYIDLGNVSGGNIFLKINLKYYVNMYGAYIPKLKTFLLVLPLQQYSGMKESNLEIVNYGWLNNQPVYPETDNATYVITIANHYPYSVRSIKAFIKLPKGFRISGPNNITYLSGPITTGATADLTYTISVGNVKPGYYRGQVSITYVINSGGASVLNVVNKEVILQVQGVGKGIEYVTSGWYGRPVQPNTYGNVMYIVFRNDVFPTMKGIVADVELPPGFTSSINNESRVRIPATSSLPQIPAGGNTPKTLSEILKGLPSQAPKNVGKGDLLYFVIPVNVLNVNPGNYTALVGISFVDQWENLRNYSLKIPISVIGSTYLIRLWSDDVLNFNKSREVIMHVKVLNDGTAPVHNVYLALYSPSQYFVLLPKRNPMYLGTIKPNKVRVINVTVFYNPITSPQLPTTVTYGNLPFMSNIIYTDPLGNLHTVNASFTVSIQPFIKLILQDITIKRESSEVSISATLTNLGNAQAQRITAKLTVGNRTGPEEFIGDLDPSSQTSFSVTINCSKSVNSVTLLITYRNPYNEPEIMKYIAQLPKYYPTITTSPVAGKAGLDIYRLSIAVAVVGFLAITGFLIYYHLKKHPIQTQGI